MNPEELAATILRWAAAAIFLGQAARKLAAPPDVPHGRAGLAAMIRRAGLPRPDALAAVVATTEAIGAMALLVGLGTRLAALVLAAVMVVAIVGFKRAQGFVGGWDWPFAVLAVLVAVAILGPGPVSLDATLFGP